ncbi:hypothetical protein ACFOOM_07665 [Streptomyces echinoruber]|uniref:Uncharacterized protein n=1 Tax=Streptomyces echinoruber TaxID=68898 RepID=A0A918R1G3_9ACTN|nr:hypothetical protein [Streptomyces echinoruber]GGZ80351.1 hypothetical protein GCM10010389_17710 [Streptomyces echinoruber]
MTDDQISEALQRLDASMVRAIKAELRRSICQGSRSPSRFLFQGETASLVHPPSSQPKE